MRRLLIATCLIFGQVVVPAVPAQAAACSGTNGVTVVVDFGSLGGGVQTRCASSDPASGLAALQAAGFSITPVQRFPGFVCRIDGKPSSDPCVNTPPDTAYWSYWYAKRGGSWTYSGEGPSTRDPAPGTVEGWAFGSGGKPGIAPPAAPAPPPPPPPPPPPAPKTSAPSPPTESPTSPSSTPSPSDTPIASSGSVALPSVAPKPASFTGFASGIGLVILLASVTVYISRRRRLPR